MDFGTGDGSKAKAWRDIWGSGQGIGAIDAVRPAGDYVARLIARICRGEGGAAGDSRGSCSPACAITPHARSVDCRSWPKKRSRPASARPMAGRPSGRAGSAMRPVASTATAGFERASPSARPGRPRDRRPRRKMKPLRRSAGSEAFSSGKVWAIGQRRAAAVGDLDAGRRPWRWRGRGRSKAGKVM